MKKIKVSLGKRSYSIWIGKALLSRTGSILKPMKLGNACYIITNPKIRSLFGKTMQRALLQAGFNVKFSTVPDSEKAKSSSVWLKTLRGIAEFDKGKGVIVIALGGGVVGDLSGFVAATYRRGVPFIQVPTTLLGQVDSAIGGKVAIDVEWAKNLVGAFYQPKAVISDISILKSLPSRQIRSGLAEIIKYGVILDKNLFAYIEKNISKILKLNPACMEHIISRCSSLKAEVVGADELERGGYRSILNFGHTAGHAIETASSYRKSLNHGEAVAVGMLVATDIAVFLKMVDEKIARRLESLIKRSGLPTHAKGVELSRVLKAASYDKKIIKGKRRWILPKDIGHVVVCHSLPDALIKKAISNRIKK
jgi:3-dehydroquinate synthase